MASRLGSINALALAAYEGNEEMVRMILNRAPAMAMERTYDGKTPLDIARDCKHANVIALLTQHAEKPASATVAPIAKVSPSAWNEAGKQTIDMRMVILGDVEALRMRLVEHPDPDEEMLNNCANALTLALTLGTIEMVAELLAYQAGAALDVLCTRAVHPLMIASDIAEKKRRMLLDHRHGKLLDPDATGNNVLQNDGGDPIS